MSKMDWISALRLERTHRENQDRIENGVSILCGLTSETKSVLTNLYTYAAGNEDFCAWPTISRLAEDMGVSRETVRKHLERAERLGWVRSELYGAEDNPLRRWFLQIPEQRNPRKGRTSIRTTPKGGQENASGQPLTTGQEMIRGGQEVTTPDNAVATPAQRVATEYKVERELESKEKGKEAATRTHEPREAAAAAKGQDSNPDHDQPKAAAAASREPAQTSTAASQDEPSEELVVWLGTTLKERVAGLVQTPGEVKRGQVKPALRTLKRWADRDESKVRAYLADELDRQEGRDDHEKARTVGKLIEWLADKRSWTTWRDAAPSAVSLTGGKPINRGRPPRPGMVWNDHINDWTNATAIHTGLFKRINLGSDDDDIVYDPTQGVQR